VFLESAPFEELSSKTKLLFRRRETAPFHLNPDTEIGFPEGKNDRTQIETVHSKRENGILETKNGFQEGKSRIPESKNGIPEGTNENSQTEIEIPATRVGIPVSKTDFRKAK
jgi:hypothetical protein